jgi:mannose-6-phosphate isomerase
MLSEKAHVKVCPLRLQAIFSPRPWGVRSLAPLFPEKSNLDQPLGEAWLTGLDCSFANGPFAGKKLGEAWHAMNADWSGTSVDVGAGFPLLVKFLFTSDKLSVQVHPDDAYAARHEIAAGGRGKTEMWYALCAEPGAEVLVGLDRDVTPERFRCAIADGAAERFLQHVPVHPGEAVFVPARTAHTIGPGLVLCEIQEYSDLTYRVYDYNRRDAKGNARELHIEKALEVMQFGQQSGGKIAPLCIDRGAVTETYFLACRYFAAEKWDFEQPMAAASSREHFDLLVFFEGSGTIENHDEHFDYAPAQAWMIPAALGAYEISPRSRTSLLRTYVPTDMNEFVARLEERGVKKDAWSRLIYP